MKKGKNIKVDTPVIKMVVAGLLVVFLIFSARVRMNSPLDKIELKIKTRGDKKQLVDKNDVKRILRDVVGMPISKANLEQLDLFELESALEADERISRAEMFIDKHKVLRIGILQNLPIARVEVTDGEDYYLDPLGKRIPIEGDLMRVPVVTGHVDAYRSNYKKRKEHNLNYIYEVSQKVYEDDFLTALVSQIHITEENDIVLIPIMGRERIALGPAGNLDDKLYKLKTYYKEGVKTIGLDRFKQLDLRYEGQIVAEEEES